MLKRERVNFTSFSRFCQNVRSIFRDAHNIFDIVEQDQDAFCAGRRVFFFEKHEPSSLYMFLS